MSVASETTQELALRIKSLVDDLVERCSQTGINEIKKTNSPVIDVIVIDKLIELLQSLFTNEHDLRDLGNNGYAGEYEKLMIKTLKNCEQINTLYSKNNVDEMLMELWDICTPRDTYGRANLSIESVLETFGDDEVGLQSLDLEKMSKYIDEHEKVKDLLTLRDELLRFITPFNNAIRIAITNALYKYKQGVLVNDLYRARSIRL